MKKHEITQGERSPCVISCFFIFRWCLVLGVWRPPRDGHCRGRHASYWNASPLENICIRVQKNWKIPVFLSPAHFPLYLAEKRDTIHTHFYKMKFLAVFLILLLVKKNEFGLCFSPLLSALETKHVTSTSDEGKILFTTQKS